MLKKYDIVTDIVNLRAGTSENSTLPFYSQTDKVQRVVVEPVCLALSAR